MLWALSASKMHFVVGALPRTPPGEVTALPRPSSWCEWARCPLPKNSSPAVGFRPRILAIRALRVHPKTYSWLRHCGPLLTKKKTFMRKPLKPGLAITFCYRHHEFSIRACSTTLVWPIAPSATAFGTLEQPTINADRYWCLVAHS